MGRPHFDTFAMRHRTCFPGDDGAGKVDHPTPCQVTHICGVEPSGSRSEKSAPVVVTHVVKVTTYADGSKNGIYLPTLRTRTNEYRIVSEIPRSTERDQFKACRAGKIVVERAIITGLRPSTVQSTCDNIS